MRKHTIILTTLFLLAVSAGEALEQSPVPIIDGGPVSVAASGDIILTGDSLGNLSAIRNYAEIWNVNYSDSSCIGTPAILDGQVVFAQVTGEITCLNISDGSLVWRYVPVVSEYSYEGLNDGVALGDGRVYAAFMSGNLRALDFESGRVLWTYESKQGLRTAPAYSEGLVLLGEYNGLFSIIDAESGKRLNGGGAGGAVNTPSVSDGRVYYSAWDGSVHAVQLDGVIPLWDAKAGEPVTTAPVIAEGLVVVGTASGKIVALGQSDGAKLWEYDSQEGQLRLSVSSGRVSAGTENGRTLVLEAKTGKLISEDK